MFKLLLKHAIFEFALNVMFDKMEENIKVAPLTELLGKLVVIKITEECRELQGFPSQYICCIVSGFIGNRDGTFSIKCKLDPFAKHEGGISHTAYFDSSDIMHIREPLDDDSLKYGFL